MFVKYLSLEYSECILAFQLQFGKPFLKVMKEEFNRHQFFSTNKQYVKIKLMQNETNLWSTFLVKTKNW